MKVIANFVAVGPFGTQSVHIPYGTRPPDHLTACTDVPPALASDASIDSRAYWPVYPSGTVELALAIAALLDTMYCGTSVSVSVTWPLV